MFFIVETLYSSASALHKVKDLKFNILLIK